LKRHPVITHPPTRRAPLQAPGRGRITPDAGGPEHAAHLPPVEVAHPYSRLCGDCRAPSRPGSGTAISRCCGSGSNASRCTRISRAEGVRLSSPPRGDGTIQVTTATAATPSNAEDRSARLLCRSRVRIVLAVPIEHHSCRGLTPVVHQRAITEGSGLLVMP